MKIYFQLLPGEGKPQIPTKAYLDGKGPIPAQIRVGGES